MDDEPLWNTVYRAVRRVGRGVRPPPRRGHPDEFATWQVLVVCLLAALRDVPLARVTRDLSNWRWRAGMRRMGFLLPAVRTPHRGTVLRRAARGDFAGLLARVDRELVTRLGPGWVELVVDSTALPVGPHSGDRDASWGHHRVHGYRLHTLVTLEGVVVASAVHPARVHDQAAAKGLIAAAARESRRRRRRVRYVGGDVGYDGEPLHRCARDELGAVLVAPFNDRGGRRAMRRTPLRRALRDRWDARAVRRVRRHRTRVERVYSVAKSGRFRLYALPPFVRHLSAVRRWTDLKRLLYHADLLVKRRELRRE